MSSIDLAIAALAVTQENVFSRAQALRLGATRSLIDRRVRGGTWLLLHPGVYGLPAPASYRRRVWAGLLAISEDAVVSFQAAAALYDCTGYPAKLVVVTVRHSGWQAVEGVIVHQITDVLPHHRTTLSGLPITTRARTIVDLAAVIGPAKLGVVLDAEVAARNLTYAEVGRCLRDVARRGKPGVRKLSAVLDARGPGHVPPASHAERLLMDALRRAGEPEPRRQFPFPGRQFTNGCVDNAYVEERLVIEVDSRRWHDRIAAIKRDRDRDAEAARHGWQTHRPLAEDIKADPEGCVAIIREIRLTRRAQLGLTSTK